MSPRVALLTIAFAAFVMLVGRDAASAAQKQLSLFQANGRISGGEDDNCPGAGSCTVSLNSPLSGGGIGKSTFTATLNVDSSDPMNNGSSNGHCMVASGTGTITTVKRLTINFSTVGLLCDTGSTGSPRTYDGSYTFQGGTGTFLNTIGTGSLTVGITFETFVSFNGNWAK